jgi:hypothetical protein
MSEKNIQDVDAPAAGGEEPQKELTWEEACDHAKTNYFIVKNTIDHKEEPLEAMKELSEFIEKVVEDYTCIEGNKDFKTFFYQDLTLGLLKRLNKERSADPAVRFIRKTVLNDLNIVSRGDCRYYEAIYQIVC